MVSMNTTALESSINRSKLSVSLVGRAEALQHRAEAGLDLFLWCGSHAAKGASMEGIVGTDDLVAAAFFVIALLATVQTVNLIRASLASAPLLQKRMLQEHVRSMSRSASFVWPGIP